MNHVKKALRDIKKSYDEFFDELKDWHRKKPDEFKLFLDRPK